MTTIPADPAAITADIVVNVLDERFRQLRLNGDRPDGTGYAYLRDQADKAHRESARATDAGACTWRLLLREEYREAVAHEKPEALRDALVRLSAVALAWIEALDRREEGGEAA